MAAGHEADQGDQADRDTGSDRGADADGPGDAYEARPWLSEYPERVPDRLTPSRSNGYELLRATVERFGDRPALHYFDATLTYRELDAMSDALAAALAEGGIRRGDRVAIYSQNIPQFVISQHAVWKLGAILVLCNPMLQRGELAYQLADSGARALICQEDLYERVARDAAPPCVASVITTSELDLLPTDARRPATLAGSVKRTFAETRDWLTLVDAYAGRTVPDPRLSPDDPALLTYTSGTTGHPKGAINTHGNVAYTAEVYRVWMDLTPDDVVVGMAPFFHITGQIAHVAVAALVGMPLVAFYRFDAAECLRLIERWRGSFTVAAITAFLALMDCPDIRTRDLSSLRKVYSGGAPIAPASVDRFERLTGAYIHNIYGLTETTSPSHAVPMGRRAPVDDASGALSVGVPIPGSVSKIVDIETGAPVPVGEIGELITKGPEVVPGYWGKPEETRRAIRDGYLYTGDIARMDERGYFYIVDRKKDMIIASGFKVWPREVEDVLYQHPAVREAAVVGVPDAYRGESVKAYVALRADAAPPPTPEELIAFCRERLAAYKYPRAVAILPELPKTATGKFLRRELRDGAARASREDPGAG